VRSPYLAAKPERDGDDGKRVEGSEALEEEE
jgi:hypothetical protein